MRCVCACVCVCVGGGGGVAKQGGTRSAALNFPLVAPADGTTCAALRRELNSLLALAASGHAFPDDAVVVKSREEVAGDCRAFDASVSLKVALEHTAQQNQQRGQLQRKPQQQNAEREEEEEEKEEEQAAAAAFLQE